MAKRGGLYVRLAYIFGTLAAIVAIIIILLNIFTPKDSHITSEDSLQSIEAVHCKTENLASPFFETNGAKNVEHEVKITLMNDKVDKMSYTYIGLFESKDETEKALSALHAKYNIYMDTTDIYHEDLYPTFSNLGTKGIINLYIQDKTFNLDTAKLILLSDYEYEQFSGYNIETLAKIYENKGFVCEITK